jgi:hypothetical protein
MPSTNRILQNIQSADDARGEAYAAVNSYIDWREQLDKITVKISELSTQNCPNNGEVSRVRADLKAAVKVDDQYQGYIFNRNQDNDIINRAKKLHLEIADKCVPEDENNDRGASNIASLTYMEWKQRLDNVSGKMDELAGRNCTNHAEIAEVSAELKYAIRADKDYQNYQGSIYNRVGDLGVDLIMSAEKLHENSLNKCEAPAVKETMPAANNTDHAFTLLLSGSTLLVAVLILSRFQSFRRMATACVDAAAGFKGSFFKPSHAVSCTSCVEDEVEELVLPSQNNVM